MVWFEEAPFLMIQKCFEYQSNKTIKDGLDCLGKFWPETPMIFMGKSLEIPDVSGEEKNPSNQPSPGPSSRTGTFLFLSIFKCPAAEFQKGTGTASAPVPPAHVMTCHDKASLSIIKNHNVVNAIATHEQFTQYSDIFGYPKNGGWTVA